ncbi:MAG: UbiX family flavin prenyltransferase [Campylobacter sp.]|uniref:UbiX family flavin prenyltransferase n=1 Tax=Campylobacter sp. TaxID=205 RepID=UPI002A83C6A4|nr:UbiX family flavin prenyltransferase [Campylobacter sp.]MCI6340252.1 UbiX family flavin prenyltransferase [Campylobacter sp.]MCI7102907.1 UbiX family flavin prenyltransferase [Campylobacter sp.]MCI7582041.1 UbiX family flavin prenyltransferase [Campylobacter sp.]MDY4445774.1 UbiX family flavin prenyltransferase [Campylobacter sp.]
MKIIVGISGASSVHLGIRVANEILAAGHEVCAIISDGARVTFKSEKAWEYLSNSRIPKANLGNSRIPNQNLGNSRISKENFLQIEEFLDEKIDIQSNMSAAAASGSSGYEAMIIAPCSSNTLAKVAAGICDNLLLRAAAVMLKEQRKLIIAPREMPFSPLSIKHMSELSGLGVMFALPMIAHYSKPLSLNDAENFIIGKWLDCLNIKNNLFKRWKI